MKEQTVGMIGVILVFLAIFGIMYIEIPVNAVNEKVIDKDIVAPSSLADTPEFDLVTEHYVVPVTKEVYFHARVNDTLHIELDRTDMPCDKVSYIIEEKDND